MCDNQNILPWNMSFKGWREIFNYNVELEYGYFYIGQFDGYHIWCYLDEYGKVISRRKKSNEPFHFIHQLNEYHAPNIKSDGRVKEGFTFY